MGLTLFIAHQILKCRKNSRSHYNKSQSRTNKNGKTGQQNVEK